jgi:hypothetical protein
MLAEADVEEPLMPPLPDSFAHYRFALGSLLHGAVGIERHDKEARRIAELRNWEFFGAPLTGVVCLHRDLDKVDALDIGMFLQTLILALTARGLNTCVQVAIAGHPDAVRKELDIPDDMIILCGLTVGYPDPTAPINSVRTSREEIPRARDVQRRVSLAFDVGGHGVPRSSRRG